MERGRGGRETEGKKGQEREREREREREGGAAQWPVVSVGLYGPVGAAARAVAGVCSSHWSTDTNTDNGTDAGTLGTHAHRAHRHRHIWTKHIRMQVQRCNGEAEGSSLHR